MTRSLLAVGLGCALAVPAAAQPKRSPALLQALADWEARQARHKTARYVITGSWEWLKATYDQAPVPPPGERVRPRRLVAVLDLARGRYRYELSYDELLKDGSYRPRHHVWTFDGSESREWTPREEAGRIGTLDLVISPDYAKERGGPMPQWFLWPVLYAHGIVPHPHQSVGFARLPWRYDPEDFVYVGRLPLVGRGCEVIRSEPTETDPPGYEEYWVDPARGGAIVRYSDHVGKDTYTRTDIRWRPGTGGWDLEGWTEARGGSTGTGEVTTYRVESAEFDGPVADAEFTIPAEPGMERVRVNEHDPRPGVILGAIRYFRIEPDGTWVQTSSVGARTVGGEEPPPPPRRPWWHWAALAGGTTAVLGVGAWRWRRGRRSPPPGSAV